MKKRAESSTGIGSAFAAPSAWRYRGHSNWSRGRGKYPTDNPIARPTYSTVPVAANVNVKCHICSRSGHLARTCNDRDNFAFVAGCVVDTNNYSDRTVDDAWCLDSGASHHMTPTVVMMREVQPYEGNLAIIVGNGFLDLKNTLCAPI